MATVADIRAVLIDFLKEMGASLPATPGSHNARFAESACKEALRLGFHPEQISDPKFQRAFEPSAAMIPTIYPHQKEDTQYWICLFTTCILYFDDLAMGDQFTIKGCGIIAPMEGDTQGHPMARNLTTLLRTTEEHFGQLSANLIVADTFRYMSSVILENQAHGFQFQIHKGAVSYPGFLRSLTGLSISYVIFAFPHTPIQEYIQVLPEMGRYFENTNDLLSFYKEEIEGEENNHIGLLSRTEGCDKIEAMKRLAKRTIEDFHRVRDVLAPEVYSIAREYVFLGYITFHGTSRRYKLDDLHLQEECDH